MKPDWHQCQWHLISVVTSALILVMVHDIASTHLELINRSCWRVSDLHHCCAMHYYAELWIKPDWQWYHDTWCQCCTYTIVIVVVHMLKWLCWTVSDLHHLHNTLICLYWASDLLSSYTDTILDVNAALTQVMAHDFAALNNLLLEYLHALVLSCWTVRLISDLHHCCTIRTVLMQLWMQLIYMYYAQCTHNNPRASFPDKPHTQISLEWTPVTAAPMPCCAWNVLPPCPVLP